MRPIYTLLAGATLLLAGCSSSHQVSQTPDDVYYSPGHASKSYAAANSSDGDGQEYYSTAPSDQYVQMKSVDQARWSYFDDYNDYDSYYAPPPGLAFGGGGYPGYYSGLGYGYGLSSFNIGLGFGDPYFGWNSYFLWNSCYNPYFYNPYYGGSVMVINSKYAATPVYTHLRAFNPSNYHSNVFVNGNSNGRAYRPIGSSSSPGTRYYNNNNNYRPVNNTGSGGSFGGSQPTRSFTPSSGGGGGGSFSRPGRH